MLFRSVVASVSEKSEEYAHQVRDRLFEAGLRVELDTTAERIGPKKHKAREQKIPYILVVGEKEAADQTVNVNDRTGKTLGTQPLDTFLERAVREVQERSLGQGQENV